MPIRLKPTAQIVEKYVNRAAAAQADYTSGVQNPKRDYEQATAASVDSYNAGVQQAIAAGSFAKGVAGAGEKQKRKAVAVGAARYPQGVQAAKQDFASGVQPFLETIAGLDLPPRRPRGDPGNIARVQMVNAALRARKIGA